ILCSVGEKISNIQDTPSTAINLMYKKLVKNQIEYSELVVFGFYNEQIISELLTDISFFLLYIKIEKFSVVISKIGNSLQENLFYTRSGYISSLIIYHNSETYFVLQKILEDCCSLQIFKDKNEIQQHVGKIPTIVWQEYGMFQNKDHLALFGLKI
ncbi:29065_t:CDS:1, partial [Racocetra persica]